MANPTVYLSRKYSRKTAAWAGLFLAVAILALILVYKKTKSPVIDSKNARSETQKELLQDQDGDGLQNWEEQLYKTSSDTPDTDGDGTLDGEEIKQGRDPLVPGPDDSVTKNDRPADLEDRNLTQEIFQEFMRSGGLATLLQQGGGLQDPSAAISQKIDGFLKTGLISSYTPTAKPVESLKVIPDSNQKALIKYFNELNSILAKYEKNSPAEDDLDLFLEIIDAGETERLSELAPYRENMEKIAAALRMMEVPKDMEEFHTKEIWFLDESVKQLKILERADQDPAAALAVIPARLDLKMEIARFHTELEQLIENNS